MSGRPNVPEGYTADKVRFQHAAGEKLPFPDGSQDLVSACLVFHELPASAAAEVIAEAHRVLRPGGEEGGYPIHLSPSFHFIHTHRRVGVFAAFVYKLTPFHFYLSPPDLTS